MAPKPITISDFTGGRNSKASSPVLAANETLDQWNTWCENKALVKRRGYTAVDSTIVGEASDIIKMCLTNLGASGANRLVMMARKGSGTAYAARLIYTDNGTSFQNCEVSPTLFSGASVPFMGMFGAGLYVSDGVNSAVRYDGTNVTTVAAFPKEAKCAVHKNYIFTAKGSTLKWCALKDPTTWPVNNFQSIQAEDGDSIMALKPWSNGLIIFKRRSMWILIGEVFDPADAQYYVQRIDTPSNFTFQFGQTIVTHNSVLKFLTADGFYAYSGGSQIAKISDPIQPDVDGLDVNSTYDTANELELPDTAPKAFVWKNTLRCSVLVGGNRRMIVQDENNKWWLWVENSFAASPMEVISANLGSGEKVFGGLSKYSLFLTLDTGYAIGTGAGAITGYWVSKDFNLPNESKFFYADIALKKQTAVGGLGTLVFSVSIDGAAYINFNVDMMNGVGAILRKRIPLYRMGRSIKVKVQNAELGVTFEIYQISVSYQPTSATR